MTERLKVVTVVIGGFVGIPGRILGKYRYRKDWEIKDREEKSRTLVGRAS